MYIKNLVKAFFILCIITLCTQFKAAAYYVPVSVIGSTTGNDDSMQIVKMERRVNEIRGMDIQDMSSTQKASLRVELKQMLKQARGYDDGHYSGVYLSVGGLIIIILLLILILR
jgi:hypothetical protein